MAMAGWMNGVDGVDGVDGQRRLCSAGAIRCRAGGALQRVRERSIYVHQSKDVVVVAL